MYADTVKQHFLSNIDVNTRTGTCAICGSIRVTYSGVTSNGFLRWKCGTKVRHYKKPYLKHKKETCERCGFIPEHPSQLDVDHIDGNHKNNDFSNLQTLCANCHRLKTFQSKDWEKTPLVNPLETL